MTDPRLQPQQTPHGWAWSVAGHAGVEPTREAAEAQIRKHQEAKQ